MNIVDIFAQNWYLFIIGLAAAEVIVYAVYVFLKLPKNTQLAKVKQWLLWAVTEAERELGGGTGKLKLRYVYDMFIGRFPHLASTVSFEAFSLMVDEVLIKFREMVSTNQQVENYVNTTTEVK